MRALGVRPTRSVGLRVVLAQQIPAVVVAVGGSDHRMNVRARRPVVLVGSDIPDLSARHIAAALAELGRGELVFGPATDDGYWLVGMRSGAMARILFRRVRWSGPHALSDTLANAAGRRVVLLDALDDVDDPADYERWRG